jgi:hypothetical protein
MSGAAADIRRAEPLRHNALAAELAGVAVDDVAAVLKVLDQPQPDPTAAQQARQRPLRVSIGSRRKSWPSSSSKSKAYENTLSSARR